MKYELLDSFYSDYKQLSEAERRMFRGAVQQMNRAYAQHTGPGLPRWPGFTCQTHGQREGYLGDDVILLRPRWARYFRAYHH